MSGESKRRVALAAGLLMIGFGFGFHAPQLLRAQISKTEQEPPTAWSPTRGAGARADVLGPAACAACHSSEAESHKTTPMAHASLPAAESNLLRAHPRLTFQLGPYLYQITSDGNHSTYTVSDGKQTISEPILYAFGFGTIGQTYVFEHQGSYYESRVSTFSAIQNLDITIGHSTHVPASLEEAVGNRLNATEASLCFSCHTTAAVTDHRLDVAHLIPGVSCEACHGPGAKHVAAMKSGKFESLLIFNPARLKPDELTDFCGACHRTWLDVRSLGIRGVRTVRFQPYRLVNSRCWNPDDARITCASCHNPHEQLQRNPAFYDSRCLACHLSRAGAKQTRDHPGGACPVSDRNCATCHMPKTELPGSYFKFADHWIRVVRAGEPYPE